MKNSRPIAENEIFIALDAKLEPCNGSYAKLVESTGMKDILKQKNLVEPKVN